MSISKNCAVLATVALAAIGSLLPAPSQAQSRVEAGILNCTVEGGIGLLVGSRKAMTCTYENPAGEVVNYGGRVDRFGLDVGITNESFITWVVYAPTARPATEALAGPYAGVSAEATAGIGLGANVLIGGSANNIALQPVSVQTQTGLNVAVGIGVMHLEVAN